MSIHIFSLFKIEIFNVERRMRSRLGTNFILLQIGRIKFLESQRITKNMNGILGKNSINYILFLQNMYFLDYAQIHVSAGVLRNDYLKLNGRATCFSTPTLR